MRRILRQFGYVVLASLAGIYLYSALRGPQGLPALRQKWDEVKRLELENEALRQQIEQKKNRIKDLQFNPEVQGTEIQKRAGKQRPGDRTYILPGARADGQPDSPAAN